MRASLSANVEMLQLYWQIGDDLNQRRSVEGWGTKILDRISRDLRSAFPDQGGFSISNLKYMKVFAREWKQEQISQQAVGQLPWGHNIVLLTKLKDPASRLAYAQATVEHGWSRNVLAIHIESKLLDRQGSAVTNFERTIPAPDTGLAQESIKDPYRLGFLGLGEEAQERAIETALVNHVAEFLVELGSGFAYMGRQVQIEVGGDDFYIDLLFYHVKLHRYVVIELKAGAFKPEYIGKLNFYLTAVDRQVKTDADGPTIGLLLCKSKNGLVAEYSVQDVTKPLGVAEYQLSEVLPEQLRTSLPTIEEIERELGEIETD